MRESAAEMPLVRRKLAAAPYSTIVERAVGGGIEIVGVERAAFGTGAQRERRLAAAPGEDVHHAADRVAAIERALRPAQNLDAIDPAGQQISQRRFVVHGARIVDAHAVDQDQRLPGLCAAQADGGVLPQAAVAHDDGARNFLQRIADIETICCAAN